MNILVIGDVVGKKGIETAQKYIKQIKEENVIDFIILNGENAADGMGITEKDYKDFLAMDVDVVTLGNHTWAKKEVFRFIDDKSIVRPANYPQAVPGAGYRIFNAKNKKIAVVSLLGRVDINVLSENPFLTADRIVAKIKNDVDIIIIDFHAEATAEKKAMGYYLDGKVSIIFGTHTHIQTSDEQILPKGTAYITDIGMVGPKNSVIGMDIDASIKRFVTTLPEKYRVAISDENIFNACVFELNDENCQIENINRIGC